MHRRKHGFHFDLSEVMFGILAFQQACINRKKDSPDPKFTKFLYSSLLKGEAVLDQEQSEDEMKALLGGSIPKPKRRSPAAKKVVKRRGSKI